MSKQRKDVKAHAQKRATIGGDDAQKDPARPLREARAWATVNKLSGADNKMGARRKVPSGPLGGSGRKTNQSRSS